jgi:hypothetical protein
MAFLGAVDIPTRGVEDFRATLKDRELKLANAKKLVINRRGCNWAC